MSNENNVQRRPKGHVIAHPSSDTAGAGWVALEITRSGADAIAGIGASQANVVNLTFKRALEGYDVTLIPSAKSRERFDVANPDGFIIGCDYEVICPEGRPWALDRHSIVGWSDEQQRITGIKRCPSLSQQLDELLPQWLNPNWRQIRTVLTVRHGQSVAEMFPPDDPALVKFLTPPPPPSTTRRLLPEERRKAEAWARRAGKRVSPGSGPRVVSLEGDGHAGA